MPPRSPYHMLLAPLPITRATTDRAALVIVDAQMAMTSRESGLGKEARLRGIEREFDEYYRQVDAAIPNMVRLAEAVRLGGGLVAHSLLCDSPNLSRQLRVGRMPLPHPDVAASQIPAVLAPGLGDEVHLRSTYGAFADGHLEQVLLARRIERVFLAGTLANISVALTAREAADRDFLVYVVQDACAAETFEWHGLAMGGLAGGAIRPVWTDEAIEILEGRRS